MIRLRGRPLSNDDRKYFFERAKAERAMAERSSNPDVAVVHLKMAMLYEAAAHRIIREEANSSLRLGERPFVIGSNWN